MSYDVSIGDEDFNVTYNISKLFYDHIPGGEGLRSLDGKTGRQAVDVLTSTFEALERTRHRYWKLDAIGEPAFCRAYDAPNGWGSTVGGIVFLGQLLAACANNPRKKVRVS